MSSTLSGVEMRAALDTLHAIGQDCVDSGDFARRGVQCLPRLVSSELTTLSVCNLDSGHRRVVCDQPGAISRRELEVFDRHFFDHPLVREHGRNPAAVTRRIEDLLPGQAFQRTPLFNDYYRPIRIDHAMAVPIHVNRHILVSFVVNRSKRGFSDRDRERVEIIRPHLGHLYRLSARTQKEGTPSDFKTPLTARERDVLDWLGAGKTDKDIAAILTISPRTVQKHLQRIYEKLGVENRTAAVMRAIATRH
ncbi:MAG TPA: LuxR C-terminal-related transcriptional regulator [Burkholderiaceae bacterium]|nr:LuxR C-terminal-related transcriptional regulator [Burkholderiaceae bacterium]